jgi:hypothetical protein
MLVSNTDSGRNPTEANAFQDGGDQGTTDRPPGLEAEVDVHGRDHPAEETAGDHRPPRQLRLVGRWAIDLFRGAARLTVAQIRNHPMLPGKRIFGNRLAFML